MTNLTPKQLKQVEQANKYWGRRLEEVNHAIEELHEDNLKKLLLKEYKRTQREIGRLVNNLYIDMLENGGVTPSALYEYGRFKALSARFNKEIKRLGGKEVNLVKAELEQAYVGCFGKTCEEFGLVDFTLPNSKAIERVVAAKWLGDNYSNRIWKNKTKLLNKLEINIRNCVSLGMSKDKAVKDIVQAFGSSFSDADRLIRSELMHTNNSAQIDVARKANYKTKIWLTAKDERVCKICGPLDGTPFPLDADMHDHARGRCTWIFAKDFSEKTIPNNSESDIIPLDDIVIAKSLGAGAFRDSIKLPNGKTAKIVEGTKITKVVVFAGKGTNKSIKVAGHLSKQYNVPESEWKKVRGDGYVDVDGTLRHAELHWFESEQTGRIKMKVKRWFDES